MSLPPTGPRALRAALAATLALSACATAPDEAGLPSIAPVIVAPGDQITRQPPASLEPLADGTVVLEDGPFSDRVTVDDATLSPGARPRVSGTVENIVDVSELIVMEIRVDFYGADGRFVGTGNQVFDTESSEPFHGQPLPFEVIAPEQASGARFALLSIPALVNE